MNWKPISEAPKDGTRLLLANDKFFAAGYRDFRIEEDWKYLGYDEGLSYPNGGLKIGPRFTERVPNPNAGKRHEWWSLDNASAFSKDDEQSPDYDGNFESWEPTHFMPLPEPPK